MTPHLDDNANIGNNAMPLGARYVTTMSSLEMLSDNTTLCDNNAMLGNNATLRNDTMPLGNNTKLVAQTLQRHARQRHHAW